MKSSFHPYISYFGKTNFRNERNTFGIYQHDRFVGMYLLGKTGTGKTNLLETLIHQDIIYNRGLSLFDINGDLVKKLHTSIPQHRKQDVIYLDTSNPSLQLINHRAIREIAIKIVLAFS